MGGRGNEEPVLWGVESGEQENGNSTATAITNLISSEVLRLPPTQDLPTLFEQRSLLFPIKTPDRSASPRAKQK